MAERMAAMTDDFARAYMRANSPGYPDGVPTPPLAERAPEVAELVAAIKTAGGFGPGYEPHERSDIIAELLTQWLDWHGYEMGETPAAGRGELCEGTDPDCGFEAHDMPGVCGNCGYALRGDVVYRVSTATGVSRPAFSPSGQMWDWTPQTSADYGDLAEAVAAADAIAPADGLMVQLCRYPAPDPQTAPCMAQRIGQGTWRGHDREFANLAELLPGGAS